MACFDLKLRSLADNSVYYCLSTMQGCPWPFPCATIKVILLIIEGLLCVYMCKDNEIYNYNITVLTFYYNLAFPVFAAAWSELITTLTTESCGQLLYVQD